MEEKAGWIFSGLLHGLIIFFLGWGFVWHRPLPLEVSSTLSVDVVALDTISQAPQKPSPSQPAPPQPEMKQEPQPEPVIEKIPDVQETLETLPPPTALPEPEPEPQKIEKKEMEEQAKPQESLDPLPQPQKKVKPKKKLPMDTKPQKKTKPPQKKPQHIASEVSKLLDNLATSDEPSSQSPVSSDTLSLSEQYSIKQQIQKCWNIPSAAQGQDITVTLYLMMNPDGTVKQAKIKDEEGSINHPLYRVTAHSALRAVRNPQCVPLKLPSEKYSSWKEIELSFNPKEVF